MKIGIYPGCSLTGSAREYNESVINLSKAFGIELEQIPDWNCCGATAAHNLNKDLSLALPARILAGAEKAGLTELVVPCAACYSRLMVTQYELNHDPVLKNRINEIIEGDLKGTTTIINVIQFIDKYIIPGLDGKVKRNFNYKSACYYGCLMVRPHKILKYDRQEDPQTMDVVMKKIGSDAIDWAFKTECCGAGLSISKTELVGKLSGNIIKDAVDRGAEVMIVACPMCHSNLDMRRPAVTEYHKRAFEMPVIYITQAILWAMGASEEQTGFKRHFVPVELPEKKEVPAPAPKAKAKAAEQEETNVTE